MRIVAAFTLAFFAGVQLLSAQENLQMLQTPGTQSKRDAASYGIGFDLGSSLASNGFSETDLVQADLLAGILDALKGSDLAVPPEQIQSGIQELVKKIKERTAEVAKNQMKKAQAFLEENKKKDGVQSTETGLQYKVVKTGTGASPKADSTVSVHYEGKLVNGTVFDSSIKRGEPATFEVGRVIPGWTEALKRMKVGDKWQLFIPPNLAYGEDGFPPAIGPNELLIFDVELLEVK